MGQTKHRKGEYDDRLSDMMTAMHEHIKADSAAFAELGKAILEINQDVKSLLNSRSFLRGAWFALGISASVLVGAATLFLTWFR